MKKTVLTDVDILSQEVHGRVRYDVRPHPPVTKGSEPVDLTEYTMREHKEKVLAAMRKRDIDVLAVYGDREHGANFGYLTGFEPRFEEGLLVLHKNGDAVLMLGNENLKMTQYARIKAQAVHVPHFSLPNQPMKTDYKFSELLGRAGIQKGRTVGIVGWKLFTGLFEDNKKMFDVPGFIVDSIKGICGDGAVLNATDMFIHPLYGVRLQMNANEIAHYEYGASQAAYCVYKVMDSIEPEKTELELADLLAAHGQPPSVQTICASGQRFTNAVAAPRNKKIEAGEPVTVTMGLRGGLTHRCGYAVSDEQQLHPGKRDYLERVAVPYYRALTAWYSGIGIGVKAADIYRRTEQILPAETYGWSLNPGHYVAEEEWMSSPFYPDSPVVLKSGMMLQMDIIIHVKGYGGANAEDGAALADESLRNQIKEHYPELWKRFEKRREYMRNILGIPIKDEMLPMSMLCGYFRPYLLDKQKAFYIAD